MTKVLAAVFVVAAVFGAVTAPVEASSARSCADDSWCDYGQVCIKNPNNPTLGVCVKGSR